ncbi:hypothetical protein IMZ48_36275 [Candidatus Bathyarchaeota archaeon]|nr:hypothetical protein [Candidatus Bathyarchaeota archaeon]
MFKKAGSEFEKIMDDNMDKWESEIQAIRDGKPTSRPPSLGGMFRARRYGALVKISNTAC